MDWSGAVPALGEFWGAGGTSAKENEARDVLVGWGIAKVSHLFFSRSIMRTRWPSSATPTR